MNQETIYTADIVVPITAVPIANGAIHVKDGRIAAVGPADILCQQAATAEVVDFGAAILMPPLVNAHTHLELTDFPDWQGEAGAGGEGGFVDWILQLIRIKHELEPEQLQRSVAHGLEQMLQSGTGAICDVLSVANLDHCYQESPLIGWLCYELIGQDLGMGAVLPMMAQDWLQAPELKTLQRGLSPHSPYTVGPQTLQKLAELGKLARALSTMHVAESSEESAFLDSSAGSIATQLYPTVGWLPPAPPLATDTISYLERADALFPGNLLVHGVQFDAAAIHQIARSGSSVVLCPRSNARLGVGRAPVESYLCQGVNLALGTDSLASNDSLSLWDEMEFVRSVYGAALSAIQVLAMATINGARALRLDHKLGALEPGTAASFQVLKPAQLPELAEVADFLCHGARSGEVAHLYLEHSDLLKPCDIIEP